MVVQFRPLGASAEREMVNQWAWVDAPLERPCVGRRDHDDYVAENASGEVVGYCSFGRHSMVPMLADEDGFANVAWGLRPDLVGQGNGTAFVRAIVDMAGEQYPSRIVRASIREGNTPSLQAATGAGFKEIARIAGNVILEHRP